MRAGAVGRWCAGVALLALLGGCARFVVRMPDGRVEHFRKSEFKAYVKQVFLRQNRATERLIATLDAGADSPALDAAEDAMQTACAPLIALVQAKVDRRRGSLADKLAMPEVAPRCEAAVARVEALLPPP